MKPEEKARKRIDEMLALAGWNVEDPSQIEQELDLDLGAAGLVAAEPSTPYGGHKFVDYALMQHGKPIAVIEAKRTSKDPIVGQEQALQYAQNIQAIYGVELPFIMYSNSHDTYLWESDFYPPRKVLGFPTRSDLEWMMQRRKTRRPLSVEMINTDIAGRDYQIAAIRAILENIEKKKRKFLLVMATGTGKTRTAIALMDVLFRAHWAKRILFLVDRIALRNQAIDAFKEHLPSFPHWPQEGEKTFDTNRRIYASTYPTMLNIIEGGKDPSSWLSPHFFDVIIADESHRSVYNTYKSVLNYFDALKLGLTATPIAKKQSGNALPEHLEEDPVVRDTFKLFDCAVNDPTFAYTFEEAIEHIPPYLNNFDVLKVRSKFQLEGIKGEKLSISEQKKLIAEGQEPEELDFEGTDLERRVTNAGTNRLLIQEFMEECIKDPTGTLPGKTIFFAISKAHARRLIDLFNEMYPEHGGKLARLFVSDDSTVYKPDGLLAQFKKNPFPRVAVSIDMLDTGVDVREVVNLVFAKPVFSYTKFWQMIGRGTRVLEEDREKRKPWCLDKDEFLIIDCWESFERFKMKPKGREVKEQLPLPVKLFRDRLDQLESAIAKGEDEIVERVKETLKADIADLPENNVVVLGKQAELSQVQPDAFWDDLKLDSVAYLRTTIAPILRARSGIEEKSMRFESQVVRLSSAMLSGEQSTVEGLQEKIVGQVAELPLTVNVVKKEEDLIREVLKPEWWSNPTDDQITSLVEKLAPLMKYRQRQREGMVELDLEDETILKDWVEFGPENERISTSAYRDRVEAHIQELVDENVALQKIREGQEISNEDLLALADLLRSQDPYVTEELLRKVYDHKAARFIRFMRHILGLEKLEPWSQEVAEAFDDFIVTHNTFTQLQIQFLQTLRTFILQTGGVERRDLIKAPFTQIHPKGIRGLFSKDEIAEILEFTKKFVA